MDMIGDKALTTIQSVSLDLEGLTQALEAPEISPLLTISAVPIDGKIIICIENLLYPCP